MSQFTVAWPSIQGVRSGGRGPSSSMDAGARLRSQMREDPALSLMFHRFLDLPPLPASLVCSLALRPTPQTRGGCPRRPWKYDLPSPASRSSSSKSIPGLRKENLTGWEHQDSLRKCLVCASAWSEGQLWPGEFFKMPLSPRSCLMAGPRVLACARDSRCVLGCARLLAAEVALHAHLTLRVREDSLSPHTESGVQMAHS